MFSRIFRQFAAVPRLLAAVSVLRSDVQASLRDGAVKAAWERFLGDPAVAGLVPRLSAEWRDVETAFEQLL